jgi:hypothetical protein
VTVEARLGGLKWPPLRPYQAEVSAAIMDSVRNNRGLSFTVEIARQGGKNEISSRIEVALLGLNMHRSRMGVKCAPTFVPQVTISLRRLLARLMEAGLGGVSGLEDGYKVRVGLARMAFLSAEPGANVVGHTADLILEVDEAQDVPIDKFDKDFRPMAASTGATVVYYGTAWDEASLLETMKQRHLELERKDGIRRHFEYDWTVVGASNAAYQRYVEGERERLGADHPLFLSQYCLRPLAGQGRLFGPTELALLQGSHPRADGPLAGETYVAGLDVGGSGEISVSGGHDSTVLTVARVVEGLSGGAGCEVVRHYAWTGEAHATQQAAVLALLDGTWRVGRVLVDASGLGEATAEHLRRKMGGPRVEAVKMSAPRKSELGYNLVAMVKTGRCRSYAADGSAAAAEYWRQLTRARAEYRPSKEMRFYVPESEGHDDYVVSLALCAAAADGSAPRRARGRTVEEW